MQAAYLHVFLLEHFQAPRKRIGNLQVSIVVGTARLAIVERGFHLPDGRDHLLRLFDHALLLGRHKADLIVQGIRESRKKLAKQSSARRRDSMLGDHVSYLLLPSFAIMVGDSDLIKQAVQLANYCIDLLGQVTGIHVVGTVLDAVRERGMGVGREHSGSTAEPWA
jgi:hypothetical protein